MGNQKSERKAPKSYVLTQKILEAKRPKTGRVDKFDEVEKGLCARIGTRKTSWVYFFRLDGRQHKMTFGSYPSIGIAEAREKARGFAREAEQGLDPRDAVKREREAAAEARSNTYEAVVEEFIEKHAKRRQRTWEETQRILETVPWGDKPMNSITRRDAFKLIEGYIDEEKASKARVTLSWLRTLWRYAYEREIVDAPIMDSVRPAIPKKARERVYDDDEIKRLWTAQEDLNAQERGFVKLVTLLGVRRLELAGMRWDELDDPDKPTLWTIPFERTKSKLTAKERVYLVPIPPLAARVLKTLRKKDSDEPLVFPGRHKKKPIHPSSPLMRKVRKASGVEDWIPHNHRRTITTWMQNEGASEYERGLVLNHAGSGSVTDAYSHGYSLDLKRQWIERWAGHVEGVVVGDGVSVLA